MEKKNILWIALDSIFLIVFNVAFFLLAGTDNSTSVWIAYGFIHFSYLMLLLTPLCVKKGSASADYERPLYLFSTIYFIMTLLVGIAFVYFAPESNTAVILVNLIITGIYLVMFIGSMITNEDTATNREKHEAELKYVKEVGSLLNSLVKQISDADTARKVQDTYYFINSSPVASDSSVREIELNVIEEAGRLADAVYANNIEKINELAGRIHRLGSERNRKLKLIK
ncbi:hypothetical protein LJB91_03715 [Bacteroidales bacterium OttesenSCG-928-L03]|nr:hypothetical protein [Bacteroidales bacterium OttesenSCG-928-L03]